MGNMMSKSHITATLVTVDQQMIFYTNITLELYEIMAFTDTLISSMRAGLH